MAACVANAGRAVRGKKASVSPIGTSPVADLRPPRVAASVRGETADSKSDAYRPTDASGIMCAMRKSATALALDAAHGDPIGALLYAVKVKRLQLMESGEIVPEDELIPIRLSSADELELSA